jgi:hypothetical protein
MLACDKLLKACGLIEVVVDQVHLEALDHHPGVGRANPTSSDHSNGLPLEQVPHEPILFYHYIAEQISRERINEMKEEEKTNRDADRCGSQPWYRPALMN